MFPLLFQEKQNEILREQEKRLRDEEEARKKAEEEKRIAEAFNEDYAARQAAAVAALIEKRQKLAGVPPERIYISSNPVITPTLPDGVKVEVNFDEGGERVAQPEQHTDDAGNGVKKSKIVKHMVSLSTDLCACVRSLLSTEMGKKNICWRAMETISGIPFFANIARSLDTLFSGRDITQEHFPFSLHFFP